jgi:hypothetical protein
MVALHNLCQPLDSADFIKNKDKITRIVWGVVLCLHPRLYDSIGYNE